MIYVQVSSGHNCELQVICANANLKSKLKMAFFPIFFGRRGESSNCNSEDLAENGNFSVWKGKG